MPKLLFCIIFLGTIVFTKDSFATKCPYVYLEVTGTIIDSETKQPLQGVSLFAFLNGASISGNAGWTPEYDYPNIPPSGESGKFSVPVVVSTPWVAGPPLQVDYGEPGHCGNVKDIKIMKTELIAFREGYTTKRFFVENLKFEPGDLNQNLNEKYQGKIIAPDILELHKNARF